MRRNGSNHFSIRFYYASFLIITEARIEMRRIKMIMPRDIKMGISKWKNARSIFERFME